METIEAISKSVFGIILFIPIISGIIGMFGGIIETLFLQFYNNQYYLYGPILYKTNINMNINMNIDDPQLLMELKSKVLLSWNTKISKDKKYIFARRSSFKWTQKQKIVVGRDLENKSMLLIMRTSLTQYCPAFFVLPICFIFTIYSFQNNDTEKLILALSAILLFTCVTILPFYFSDKFAKNKIKDLCDKYNSRRLEEVRKKI